MTLSKDEIDPKVLSAVHQYFPFTRSAGDSFFHCPNWAKILLYKYYTLKNVKDIIKHFNRGSDQEFNDYDLFPRKVPFMLVDDIDLMPY